MIVFYAAAKFLAYSAWCYLGLWLVQSDSRSAGSAFWLGAARWFIGVFFGIVVFFAVGSVDAGATFRLYFLIYTPIRLVEWSILAFLIARRLHREALSAALLRLPFWCVGGIFVSFLTDVLSPEGLQGRFCVGRCIC
jgi:hypothetical protein